LALGYTRVTVGTVVVAVVPSPYVQKYETIVPKSSVEVDPSKETESLLTVATNLGTGSAAAGGTETDPVLGRLTPPF
jgi:hypothetical protein